MQDQSSRPKLLSGWTHPTLAFGFSCATSALGFSISSCRNQIHFHVFDDMTSLKHFWGAKKHSGIYFFTCDGNMQKIPKDFKRITHGEGDYSQKSQSNPLATQCHTFCPASDCSSSIRSILRVHGWALGIRCARLFNFCLQQPCYMLEAEANIRIPDCTGWCIPQSPMHWVPSSPIIINQQGFEHCSSDSNSLKYNLTALRNLDLCTAVPSRSLLVFRFTGLGRWCSSLLIGYSSWSSSKTVYQRFT